MKYIKQFENIDNTIRFKKYIIYKLNNNYFFILEPILYTPTHIQTDKKYLYELIKNKLSYKKYQFYNFDYNRVKNIIYQTDNLKDAKEVIFSLSATKKYNL